MPHFICVTCGTQFAETDEPPERCEVCEDERQYVGWAGQQWTTLDELRRSHRSVVRLEELGLYGIGIEPSFAIGQRALLITNPKSNVLWDCIPLLDQSLVEMIRGIGGISAIAISHPHFYASMVEWSRAFDCPIYLHAADRRWVVRPDAAIRFWEGESKQIGNGLTLIRCGGHFEGGTVLHWPEGADGKGAILGGDILQVVQDRRWVSFMYSYPNLIPLPASAVHRIVEAVEPFEFDRIYGAWWGKVVFKDAKAAVRRSAERYIRAISSNNLGRERWSHEMEEKHQWTEDDDIVALYLYRFGPDDLPLGIAEISEKLGMKAGSLKMRIGNFQAIDGHGGLSNAAIQSRKIYETHGTTSKDELRTKVLSILGLA